MRRAVVPWPETSWRAAAEDLILTAVASNPPASWSSDWKRRVKSALPQWVQNWREAQYYLRYGELELHFLDVLCTLDRDSIDVGAHDGCYVHFLRKQSRHVLAFEPIPWMAADLVRKFPHRVTVRPEALSRADGSATLHMPVVNGHFVPGCSTISELASSTYGGNSRDLAVPVRTLDGVYAGDVGFIKIDVEGHEIEVLEGARETIARCRPNFLIEVVERLSPDGVRAVSAFLGQGGYEGFFAHRWRMLRAGAFDAASLQREEDYPDLTAPLSARDRAPRFVYNFIFLPGERVEATVPLLEARLRRLEERFTPA
jgi:FkbM family methyltransferase